MKKIVLTSIGALMLTALSAGAAETTCPKGDCSNYKIFFGINAGVQTINYDAALKTLLDNAGDPTSPDGLRTIAFPEHDTVVGMEAGMRFGKYKAVWNGGFTVGVDKTLGKKPDIQAGFKFWDEMAGKLLKEAKGTINVLSATFDNYIRLNKSLENRLDLVVGIGIADIETNMKVAGIGLSENSHAAVLKAGLELELTESISLTVGTRMYTPVAGQYYDSTYAIKGGFKFLF